MLSSSYLGVACVARLRLAAAADVAAGGELDDFARDLFLAQAAEAADELVQLGATLLRAAIIARMRASFSAAKDSIISSQSSA